MISLVLACSRQEHSSLSVSEVTGVSRASLVLLLAVQFCTSLQDTGSQASLCISRGILPTHKLETVMERRLSGTRQPLWKRKRLTRSWTPLVSSFSRANVWALVQWEQASKREATEANTWQLALSCHNSVPVFLSGWYFIWVSRANWPVSAVTHNRLLRGFRGCSSPCGLHASLFSCLTVLLSASGPHPRRSGPVDMGRDPTFHFEELIVAGGVGGWCLCRDYTLRTNIVQGQEAA